MTEKVKNPKKKARKRKILIGVVVILVAVRIALPYIVKNQLVAAINKVEGYSCTIADVDLALYRGAMVIEEFEIQITTNDVKKPFVAIKEADISVEWGAIFDGAIVGEIYLDQPILHFADGATEKEEQVGDASWVEPILDFIPLKINRFEIVNGGIEFENAKSKPPVKLELSNLSLLVTNLTNSEDKSDLLPSDVKLACKILNGGKLNIDGGVNILKELPNMDFDINLKHVNLVEINDFTTVYANFDFEKGRIDVASEFAMKDGEVDGYVKPILKDVEVFTFKEEGTLLNKTWQAFIGFAIEITENQRKDQTGTKVPISGRYDNPDVAIFTTIIGILENAFVEAYKAQTDNSINFKNIRKGKKSKKKKKK